MKKTFKWLNVSQFTGALNDNAFKMTAIILLVNMKGETSLPTVLTLCSVLFIAPFLLFSNCAGALADRYSKRDILIVSKWLEVLLFILAIPAVLSEVAWSLYALLFLLCVQSALFGPAKRSIIPELVHEEELSKANGLLTSATYAAIILGTALPSLVIGYLKWPALVVIGLGLFLAVVGTWAAHQLAIVPAAGSLQTSSPWILPDVMRAMKNLKADNWAKQAVLGLILFDGITAFFQQTLVLFGQEAMGLSVEKSPMLFLLAAIGIGIGALLTGHFSKHTIEIGLIPVGAVGVMISAIGLSTAINTYMIMFWIIVLGASCGMYLVPISAFIQQRIPAIRRGEVFGASSFLGFSAMVAASGLFYLLTKTFAISARGCVLATGLLAVIPAVLACLRLPNFFTRFWLMRLIRRLYKIRFHGLENLPREGGALLICNHTAYADALLLQAATQRPVRFILSRDVFKTWKWAKPIFKLTDCIPIHTSDGPRALAKSLQEARQTMESGAIVAIFPEGALTKDGSLMKFNKGFERIARNSNCPVIPAHIGNIWGSIFSFRDGKPGLRIPEEFPRRVTVRFGKPLPASVSADEARRVIAELGAEHAIEKSIRPGQTLCHQFIRQARRHWFRPMASDTLGKTATYGKLLLGSIVLANRLKPHTAGHTTIGIFMPTTLGGALANLAVTLSGQTVVNLNWTASAESMKFAVTQSGVRQVITSRRFLQKLTPPDLAVEWLYLEDLLNDIGQIERIRALCSAVFSTPSQLANGRAPQPQDTVAIIFSSGTTGTPKGVMLSHTNLASSIDSIQSVLRLNQQDSLCAVLPFFHAFGYLALLWWPMLKGMRVAYHPDPLQAQRVIQLIKEEKLTALLVTPTFLQTYMRKATKEDFQTVETIITGGEKLLPELAERFEQQFGIRPLEGYGCTELSPVAALNLKENNRSGSVGQPIPGVAVRIVHPETRVPLSEGEEGLLLVKGPNVMQGYLKNPEKTAEVLCDGWYNTGDIARVDEDGFIFITGRLSRFSKIGGEMVPHGAIEEVLQKACGTETLCVVVVAVSHATRGEQLAVCYTPEAGDPDRLHAILKESHLPNLWIPRRDMFFAVPEFPILGTGKLDMCTLRQRVSL